MKLLVLLSMSILLACCAVSQPQFADCGQDYECLELVATEQNQTSQASSNPIAEYGPNEHNSPIYGSPENAVMAMANYITDNGLYENSNGSCKVDESSTQSITISCWKTHLPKRIELRNYGWDGYAKLTNTHLSYTFQIQTFVYVPYFSNIPLHPQAHSGAQSTTYSTPSIPNIVEQTVTPSTDYDTTSYSAYDSPYTYPHTQEPSYSSTDYYPDSYYSDNSVYVKGHFRHYKSGKVGYVNPHYRSRPRR